MGRDNSMESGRGYNIFEKWSIGLDYFNKTTDGLLTNRVLPSYTGGGSTRINLGQMKTIV